MASSSLYLFYFKPSKEYSIDTLANIFLEYQNEDRFIINEATKTTIDGYYITYINSKEIIFNKENEELESIIVTKSLAIPFSIDLQSKLLDVWGKRNYINRFLVKLNNLLNNDVEIEPITIDLKNIVTNINNSMIKIRNVKINNYILEKDIIADCTFDLKNHNNPFAIIKKYCENLVYITLTVLIGLEDYFTMIIYKSGSVVIYKYVEELSKEELNIIHKICTS